MMVIGLPGVLFVVEWVAGVQTAMRSGNVAIMCQLVMFVENVVLYSIVKFNVVVSIIILIVVGVVVKGVAILAVPQIMVKNPVRALENVVPIITR